MSRLDLYGPDLHLVRRFGLLFITEFHGLGLNIQMWMDEKRRLLYLCLDENKLNIYSIKKFEKDNQIAV